MKPFRQILCKLCSELQLRPRFKTSSNKTKDFFQTSGKLVSMIKFAASVRVEETILSLSAIPLPLTDTQLSCLQDLHAFLSMSGKMLLQVWKIICLYLQRKVSFIAIASRIFKAPGLQPDRSGCRFSCRCTSLCYFEDPLCSVSAWNCNFSSEIIQFDSVY